MTSKIHLVIPDLFLPRQFASSACSGLAMPALEKILARSRRKALSTQSLETWLCNAFGVLDEAIAPITLQTDGMEPGQFYWLRADPVHLQLQRAHFLLRTDELLLADEAAQLCESLNAHFADERFRFFAPHPQRWYVRLESVPNLQTHPLAQVAGKNVYPYLPSGDDALYWHRVLNEVQMLLYEHPVNEARAGRGEGVVNSVWLWGGGVAQKNLQQPFSAVYGDSVLANALAKNAGVACDNFSANKAWMNNMTGDVLLVWEGLRQAMQQGDLQAWQSNALSLEQDCAAPLLKSVSEGRVGQLTIDVLHSSGAQRFVFARSDLWKVWRRSVSLSKYALK